jgi:hypothetical protein
MLPSWACRTTCHVDFTRENGQSGMEVGAGLRDGLCDSIFGARDSVLACTGLSASGSDKLSESNAEKEEDD